VLRGILNSFAGAGHVLATHRNDRRVARRPSWRSRGKLKVRHTGTFQWEARAGKVMVRTTFGPKKFRRGFKRDEAYFNVTQPV